MNSISLVGRLTKDPEVRYTQDNLAIARFTLAVSRRKANEADFPNVIAFGKTAEFIEKYFHKGMRMGLNGRIQTGSYEKDGKKVYTTEVVAESVEFVESKTEPTNKAEQNDDFMQMSTEAMEGLPFN